MKRVDVTGQTFGRVSVEGMAYEFGKDSQALCLCVCGKKFNALVYNLRNGNTKSCGCLSAERRSANGRIQGGIQGPLNATHGRSKSKTYISWLDARKRCYNKKNKRFDLYGGRGIGMDAAWAVSFEAFYAYMGDCPAGLTLDRIDVDGDYEPGNCRWATKTEQARNTRSNVCNVEIASLIRERRSAGEPAAKLAREYGMSAGNVNFIDRGITWKSLPGDRAA